jgi:sterol desaturase/sphingolipid hydroxylase (fatty acid hydroxylase superfamily)
MNGAQYIAYLDRLAKILQPGIFALAIFLFVVELVLLSRRKVQLNHKGGAVSLTSGVFVFGLEALADTFFYLALCYWLYDHRFFNLDFSWYVWVFCFLLYDLMFYVSHRLQHQVRLLWCFHSVHHTSVEMRLTSAVRGSIFDFIYNPPFFVWMCVLGIHPLMFIVVRTVSRVWGILTHVHEEFVGYLPAMNKVFITPDVHRVHHGKNAQYIDKNYAEILSVWDRLLGTYEEYDERPEYGILKPVNPNGFADIQFSSWRALYRDVKGTAGLGNKLKVILSPP